VFHVKEQPVITAISQNFDADGAAQMRPQANLFLACANGVFEFVVNGLHVAGSLEVDF
jgi:hypothetical protein